MPLSLIRIKSLAGKTTSVKAITSALITILWRPKVRVYKISPGTQGASHPPKEGPCTRNGDQQV